MNCCLSDADRSDVGESGPEAVNCRFFVPIHYLVTQNSNRNIFEITSHLR